MSDRFRFRAFYKGRMYENVVVVDGGALRRGYFATDLHSEFYKTSILMQSTGLRDKNGVLIFEGDLVKCQGTKRVGEYITSVVYDRQGFKLKLNLTSLNNDASLVGVEVIGNKFENPELLNEING